MMREFIFPVTFPSLLNNWALSPGLKWPLIGDRCSWTLLLLRALYWRESNPDQNCEFEL